METSRSPYFVRGLSHALHPRGRAARFGRQDPDWTLFTPAVLELVVGCVPSLESLHWWWGPLLPVHHQGAQECTLSRVEEQAASGGGSLSRYHWGRVGSDLYMKLRQLANLDNSMLEPGPLSPAPANDGATAWTKRPGRGRRLHQKDFGCSKTSERRISTHSFKSTLISWIAKFGLPEPSRAVLARHRSCFESWTTCWGPCGAQCFIQIARGLDLSLLQQSLWCLELLFRFLKRRLRKHLCPWLGDLWRKKLQIMVV